jgi:PleD family two-component response regulator
MSISLGHSTKTQEGQKMDALLQEAEKMLYRKKNADRKKVKKETLEILKNLNLLK